MSRDYRDDEIAELADGEAAESSLSISEGDDGRGLLHCDAGLRGGGPGAGVRGRDVLAAIFDACTGLLELRALPSRDRIFLNPCDIAATEHFAIAHRHESVFFGVATRRDASSGDLANCEQLGALFVDLDCHGNAQTLADAHARLDAFVLPPSCVIASGGGLHAYWLLKEPSDVPTEGVVLRQALRALAYTLDGDLVAAECARILRLPGSTNHKYDPPRPVTVLAFDPSRRYDLSEFEWLPRVPDAAVDAPASASITLAEPIREGGRNAALYTTGRGLKARRAPAAAIATTLQHLNSTFQPRLEAREVDAVIRQVLTQPDRSDFVPDVANATTQPRGGLVLTEMGALLAEPDEQVDYIVQGCLAASSINIVSAKPKVGKSTLVRHLAIAVARGGQWLGRACQQGCAWYLAFEGRRADIKNHFRQMGATAADPVRVFTGQAPAAVVRQLRALAIHERPALIIIDTMQRFIRAKSTDDYAEMTTLLDDVIAIARDSDAAILLLHHSNKSGRAGIDAVLGSTAICGSMDTIFLLGKSERYRTIATEQRTGVDMPEHVITLDEKTGRVQLGGSRQDADRQFVADALVTALADAGEPLTQTSLEKRVEGRTALKRAALKLVVDRGWVRKSGDGKKGKPHLYAVADTRIHVPSRTWEQQNNDVKSGDCSKQVSANACSRVPVPMAEQGRIDAKAEKTSPVVSPMEGEPAPAWVTEPAEPDFSDPIGAHDEELL